MGVARPSRYPPSRLAVATTSLPEALVASTSLTPASNARVCNSVSGLAVTPTTGTPGERFGLDTLAEARLVREHYAEELAEHAMVVHQQDPFRSRCFLAGRLPNRPFVVCR